MSEEKLQQQIFTWHWNTMPQERGLLFMVHNTPKNAIDGARLKSIGLVKGVSDIVYLKPGGIPIFIELKTDRGRQSPEQIQWQRKIQSVGYRYEIVRSLEEFKNLTLPNQ